MRRRSKAKKGKSLSSGRRRNPLSRALGLEALEPRLLLDGQGFATTLSSHYAVESRPTSLVTADIDVDGHTDIIAANRFSNSVSVLRNIGDGTFADQTIFTLEAEPSSMVAADFNGDGYADLAIGTQGSANIVVLLNDGAGTFAAAVAYAATEVTTSMIVLDINRDGHIDIVTADALSNSVSLLLNQGDGSLAPPVSYAVASRPHSVAAGDFDGDGTIDIATVGGAFLPTRLSILTNRGDATFNSYESIELGEYSVSLVTADLDGDGYADLIAAHPNDNAISVFSNEGDGSFAPKVIYAAGRGASSVAIADLNGDGYIDLAVSNADSDTVTVFTNRGDGTFPAADNYVTGNGPAAAVAADVDGDGAIDIITADADANLVSVILNLGNGSLAAQRAYYAGSGTQAVNVSDIDGDGDVDIVTGDIYDPESISVLSNLGGGTFATEVLYPVNDVYVVTTVDADGDGLLDFVTSNPQENSLSLLRNLGGGTFSTPTILAVGLDPRAVIAADINGDGAADLIAANVGDASVSLLLNTGDGTFLPSVPLEVGFWPSSLVAEDVSGDGQRDFVVANYFSNSISLLMNLGDGTFAEQVSYTVANRPQMAVVRDIDGDGDADVISVHDFGVSLLRNHGNGVFAAQVFFPTGFGASALVVEDVDGDGDNDVITANGGGVVGSVTLLRNRGNGTFRVPQEYRIGHSPTAMAAADIDSDGRIDIVTASAGSDTVLVLHNGGFNEEGSEPGISIETALDLGQLVGSQAPAPYVVEDSGFDHWFLFETVSNGKIASQVRIDFDNNQGNLDLEVFDGQGALITGSYGDGDSEAASIQGWQAGIFYIRVFGKLGATNAYHLGIDSPNAPPPPDYAEPNNTNNSPFILSSGPQTIAGLTLHSETDGSVVDIDWFKWTAAESGRIQIATGSTTPGTSLQFHVYDSSDELIAWGGTFHPQHVEFFAQAGGEYYILVGGAFDTSLYDVADYSLSLVAKEVVSLSSGEQSHTSTILFGETTWFRWSADDTLPMSVSMTSPTGDAFLYFDVYDSDQQYRASGSWDGVSSWPAELVASEGNEYFFHIYSPFGVESAEYTIAVNYVDVRDLGPVQGVQSLTGLIISAADSHWFRYELNATGTDESVIRLEFTRDAGDAWTQTDLFDADGQRIDGSFVTGGRAQINLTGHTIGKYLLRYSVVGSERNHPYNFLMMSPGANGPVPFGVSIPGSIGTEAEIDEWTFLGTAGQSVALLINAGSGGAIGAPFPAIDHIQVHIIDPLGNVITATSIVDGNELITSSILLPDSGTYVIRLNSPESHPNSTGNYLFSVWNATTDIQSLTVNERMTGTLDSTFNLDVWTFVASAGQRVQFDLLNTTLSGVRFKLSGPNGWTGFAEESDDSPIVTLPATGTYTIEVNSNSFQQGAYAFRLGSIDAAQLTLGQPYAGTTEIADQLQWFVVDVIGGSPLLVELSGTADSRHNIYVSFNTPPTRRNHIFTSTGNQSDQTVVVPLAAPGKWYILVEGREIADEVAFTLLVTAPSVIVDSIWPSQHGRSDTVILSITGSGFLPGSQVELVGSDSLVFAKSVVVESFGKVKAVFDVEGVPTGHFDIRVTQGGGAVGLLSQAFELLSSSEANLETRLILPPTLGRTAPATIFVEYANTGTAAMLAPILILQSTDDRIRPRLTLEHSRLALALWTEATEGVSDSVQIYASGATPGLLQPGEVVRVPVYYGGLSQPWDFDIDKVELEIRIHRAENPSPLDWEELKSTLKPTWLSDDAWVGVFENLQAQIGSTWGDYVRMLHENASYLGRYAGQATLDRLSNFELQQANGLSPLPTLSSAVDAYLPTPGLPLDFGRAYGNSINERYALGPFGRGWTSPWRISLERLANGTVILRESNGTERRFSPDSNRGHYRSEPGDSGRLFWIDMPQAPQYFLLRETNGMEVRFFGDGRVEYIEDVNGHRITAGYTNGQLTNLTHSSGASLFLTYNSANRIATIVDSAGRMTTYGYDATDNYLLTATGPAGTTSYTYTTGQRATQEHALTSVTGPDGLTRNFAYDERGRLISTTEAGDTEQIEYDYDETGIITVTDSAAVVSRLYVDHRGAIVRTEDGYGAYTRYEYNSAGQLVREIDALGRTTSYTWCGCGALLTVTDELGHTSRFTKGGPNNRPLGFSDAQGNATYFEYDEAGNLTDTFYADGSVEQSIFDEAGNVISAINRRGQSTHFDYNAAGQMTQVTYEDASSVDYAYDARGRLTMIIAPEGSTTFEYNAADRLVRVEYANGRWLEYDYDNAGRRTRVADHEGFEVNYRYDQAGRLFDLRNATDALIVEYSYDTAGRLSREVKGNGTYTRYSYDVVGRLSSIDHHAPDSTINSRFAYTYDASGRRIGVATLNGAWVYTYDLAGQLVRATFASATLNILDQDLSYEYDAVGNRIRTIANGITTAYVPNELNQYAITGETTYSYDVDGNLVEETGPNGTRTFSYDVRNQLIYVATPEGVWEYEYDSFGNRTARIVNGVRTDYLLDPTGRTSVLGEYDATGVRTKSYIHGVGLEGAVGADGTLFYDFDALGSTAGLSNFDGGYANAYLYDPFGRLVDSAVTTDNVFEFVGEYGVMAEGNGLYFMRARHYSPVIGRFLSEDPLGITDPSFNLYAYANNDPSRYVDVDGENPALILWGTLIATFLLQRGNVLLASPTGQRLLGILESQLPGSPALSKSLSAQLGKLAGKAKNYLLDTDIWKKLNEPAPEWMVDLILPSLDGDKGDSDIAQSIDPNEKIGLAGYGSEAFISANTPIPYRVHFENLGTGSVPTPTRPATAPAQRVVVTDQLSSQLEWESFEFTEFGFGESFISVPAGQQYHFEVVPMMYNDETIDVEVELSFDVRTGVVRVVFESLDPDTFLPPDILAGFLPPEDGSGRGKGFFAFIVFPKMNLPTGVELRNVALISFDGQTIIATNQINPQDPGEGTDSNKEALNTIDAGDPVSSVAPLTTVSSASRFEVAWHGEDDAGGAGVAAFDIFVSIDGGAFTPWLVGTNELSAQYIGASGHSYAFYSVAIDNVGHREAAPLAADAATLVIIDVDPPTEIENSAIVVDEGESITITNDYLAYDDDQFSAAVAYKVVAGLVHGQLELSTDPGTAITSFSQAEIDAGHVVYVHDGSYTPSETFYFFVEDGLGNETSIASFSIRVQRVNGWQNPIHRYNVVDDNFVDTFDLANLVHDIMERGSDRELLPVPPGTRPTLYVNINEDNFVDTLDLAFLVHYLFSTPSRPAIDPTVPGLVTNAGGTVSVGGTLVLGADILKFADLQPLEDIRYSITTFPSAGRLESILETGVAISTFSQADLNAGRIRYVHDGSSVETDSFEFNVDDGRGNIHLAEQFDLSVSGLGALTAESFAAEDSEAESEIEAEWILPVSVDVARQPIAIRMDVRSPPAGRTILGGCHPNASDHLMHSIESLEPNWGEIGAPTVGVEDDSMALDDLLQFDEEELATIAHDIAANGFALV